MSQEFEGKIIKINRNEVGEFVIEDERPGPVLGAAIGTGHKLDEQVDNLLGPYKERADRFFVVEWEGGLNPRGAIIDGKRVNSAHSNLVMDDDGEVIGLYERLVQNGGKDKKTQQILIFRDSTGTPF